MLRELRGLGPGHRKHEVQLYLRLVAAVTIGVMLLQKGTNLFRSGIVAKQQICIAYENCTQRKDEKTVVRRQNRIRKTHRKIAVWALVEIMISGISKQAVIAACNAQFIIYELYAGFS
jgi:hypothetical protein